MADFENSSSDENTSLISGGKGEDQFPSVQSKLHNTKKRSKQLRYYHRKTQGRAKRKYTPFSEQDNPSRQLKSYHATKEESLEDTEDLACFKTSNENDHHTEEKMDANESRLDYFEDDELAISTTSSMDDSDESSSLSHDGSSQSESEDYNEPEETDPPHESETAQPSEEEPLYEGSKISKILSFVLIVSFVLKHNLTNAAWADLLRLLTALLGERCKQTFQSVYKMKLFMKGYFGSKEPTKISYCANCFSQVPDRCQNAGCRGAAVSSFLDLHFEEKIKDLFKDSEFLNLLKKGKEKIKRMATNTIHDIYHGLDYKNFSHPRGFLSQPYNISFTVNTDGVNKYSSSTAGHLWPVYLMINELPKEQRFRKKFMIPAYIYCDKHDPNMLTFLNPLVEKLNNFYDSGIQVPGSADGDITVRCMLFVATADLPARAALMNMKQYNGKCACHLCKTEGTSYGQHNLHRCWPYEENHEKRTRQDQINFATKATQKQPVMGVKGHSIFAKLRYPFDLIRSFAIDWMHCVCLGVVKYVMQLQLSEGNRDKDFYIGASKASLSHRLLSIKPPDIVGRLPRSLEDLKHWKATELKNWLLHYSTSVLRNTLNPLYLFHWTLLVSGIGILCGDSISDDDLRNADDMLQAFVFLMPILYGPTKCTMNIHLLQHLAYYVSRRGPLWAYSCFAFEGMNAFIKPLVHGTHHAMEQIGCAFGLCFGLSNFTKQILANTDVSKQDKNLLRSLTCYSKSNYKTSSRVEGGFLCGKLKDNLNIDNNILTLVRVHAISNKWPQDYEIEAYRRFENDEGQKFYSSHAKTWKTDSTVIEYLDKDNVFYGRVKHFFRLNDRGLCVCDKLVESSEDFRFNMRDCDESLRSLSVSDHDRNRIRDILRRYHDKQLVRHHVNVKPSLVGPAVISVEQIRRKCVFINISTDSWTISRFPNITEHN